MTKLSALTLAGLLSIAACEQAADNEKSNEIQTNKTDSTLVENASPIDIALQQIDEAAVSYTHLTLPTKA